MRVIKVIHASDSSGSIPEVENQEFTLQKYDLTSFIMKFGPVLVEEKRTLITGVMVNTLINPLGSIFKVINNRLPDIIRTSLIEVVKATSETLLKDITDHLNHSDILTLERARAEYPRTNNLSVGTYTLHPYDSKRLTRLEHFHKNLALEKDNELIVLLGKMGAKTVRIIETNSQKKSNSLSGGAEIITVNTEANLNFAKRIEQGKELVVIFEGNIVDIDPYLLNTSLWFSNDGQLNAIFESRRFTPNKIQEYTLRNTYTETFDFDFSLATKFLVVKADLKTEYDSISKKERYFHVEFSKNIR